jgi:glyoxylase-like metal-dependent hydrolase (beta-lactamase superfamily II)
MTKLAPLPLALLAPLFALGCLPSSHPVAPAQLGVPSSSAALEAVISQPGPVTVDTIVAADWEVAREGLINLENPRAVAAHLTDGPVGIQIMFHALHHPTRGLYLVDTGVERALVDDPASAAVSGIVAIAAHTDKLRIHVDTQAWLRRQKAPPAGVFLTHIHLDHVMGMRDLAAGTPIFAGPGETTGRSFQSLFVAPVIDTALEGKGALLEWGFVPDPQGAFAGVIDVFGDTTVWALAVPGHTPGSTAYLARTPTGPVLMVGDACHTAWGWENGVEPGKFSADVPRSAESLARLQRLTARHPEIDVRLGHQQLARRSTPPGPAASAP